MAHGVGKLHILKRKGADSDEKNEECALAKKKEKEPVFQMREGQRHRQRDRRETHDGWRLFSCLVE